MSALPCWGGVATGAPAEPPAIERVRVGADATKCPVPVPEEMMRRLLTAILTVTLLSGGLAACDDEVEIETPEGEVEIEED